MKTIDTTSTREERMSTLLSSHLAHYNRDMLREEHSIYPSWIIVNFIVLLVASSLGFFMSFSRRKK